MIGALLPPELNAAAEPTQMPWPFTQLNSVHQCSAAGSAFRPEVRSQMATAWSGLARPAAGAAEGPDRLQAPAQVLQRVAQVAHLPVQHAVDLAGRVVEEVASPEVAVDHAKLLGRWRRVGAQPADGGTGDRQRLG